MALVQQKGSTHLYLAVVFVVELQVFGVVDHLVVRVLSGAGLD